MSNLKQKISYKVMALFLVVLMLVSMIPVTVIASALNALSEDPYKAANLTAVYNAENDEVDMAWEAFETEPYELWICVDGVKYAQIETTATTYSADVLSGDAKDYSVLAFVDSEDTTGTESDRISVAGAFTFDSVPTIDAISVENDLTISEIIEQLPVKTKVYIKETANTLSVDEYTIEWNAASVSYDRSSSDEQTITVPGAVNIVGETVKNREGLSTDISVEVTVKAAIDVSFTTDLDDSAPVEKKVGETLVLSVEAAGTAPEYQWYKKVENATEGTVIDGATAATLNIANLSLDDAAQYYCVVIGKNKTTVTSKIVTVNVSKNATSVDLSIDPADGQTRPQSITLEAMGIPADATGELIFKDGDEIIETITLPNDKKSTTFSAYDEKYSYDFTVIYDATNDPKYYGSEKTINGYGFDKGEQSVNFKIDTIPTEEFTYTEGITFTVEAEGADTKQYEYDIVDEVDAFGKDTSDFVASVDKNGVVTILAAGTFKITVKATSDKDYNESPVVTSQVITVKRGEQGDFAFATDADSTKYFHDFTYNRGFSATGTGDGEIKYTLGSATTATGVVVNEETGEITYADSANDNSSSFAGTAGIVEVIATKACDYRWNEKSTSYTINITKADQSTFEFANKTSEAITYTENSGTTFTNEISTEEDKNGWVNVDNNPVYTIVSETALPGDETTIANNVVSIAVDTIGTITANRSGVVTIKATLAGNGVYNDIETTYTITVNRGTINTDVNGVEDVTKFNFAVADTEIKYGFDGFKNVASGGQSDSTKEVKYSIETNEEVSVDSFGVIDFLKSPAEAATDTYSVVVTATKPQDEKYLECSISYTLTVSRDAVTTDDFTVNDETIKDATEFTKPDGWYNAEHEKITIAPVAPYTMISEDGNSWSPAIERTEDDKYAIAFYLKDDEGNITLISNQTVNYDTTKAAVEANANNVENFWNQFLNVITFGLWYNDDATVTIKASDNLSGIYSISYAEDINPSTEYATDIAVETAPLTWIDCVFEDSEIGELNVEKDIIIPEVKDGNKKSVIYLQVVDCAGNIEYFRSAGMGFDDIVPDKEVTLPDPIIEIELDETTTEGLYNDAVPFTLKVNDEQTDAIASGIKSIIVTIKGSEKETYEKIINVTAIDSEINTFNSDDVDEKQFTVDKDFVVPADFDSNHLTINVVVTDYAGNIYNNEVPVNLAIDVTNPVIEVTYDDVEDTFSNGRYIGNNKNRVATIDITELNFNNEDVVITVTCDGEEVPITPEFDAVGKDTDENAVDENGDQILYRMAIDYANLGEGDFTFDIAYADKAGNANDGWSGDDVDVNCEFTIDNTKPTISVEITNSDVRNNKYFAADRKATVTIVERNFSKDYKFDWSGLTLSLDGQALTAPTPVITENNDKTYTRVYTIDFTVEGDYTFDVGYTDLADNVADNYACSSVAYKEFTVDKTAPALEITGVANKSANNGVVAPVITYSDVNFNVDAVSIALSGVNNGVVNYDGSYTEITHGQTYTYANFEEVKAVDDIYTLSAKLTDMAGNETSKTITFSANRFGSAYDLTGVEDIINTYLPGEQDIVFTETNVDSLDRDGIKIKLTKNGTPTDLVEGTDYTVEVTGGNGQWSVYKYTVKKHLFADDGTYSISIYSVDAAGNINENIDETKEAEISFGVDKTKPVIVPIDFESNRQYAVDMKTVSIEVKDNLLLDNVRVMLNGKEVEYTVDGKTYTFEIPKSNSKQDVIIIATDSAGNEKTLKVSDFLVNANIFVRWFNNTPLFVGSIVGVVVLILAGVGFILFGIKKKK